MSSCYRERVIPLRWSLNWGYNWRQVTLTWHKTDAQRMIRMIWQSWDGPREIWRVREARIIYGHLRRQKLGITTLSINFIMEAPEIRVLNWILHITVQAGGHLLKMNWKNCHDVQIKCLRIMVCGLWIKAWGVNSTLAVSNIRNRTYTDYEVYLIDYGYGNFKEKIHFME